MTIYSVYSREASERDSGHEFRFVPDAKSIWALIAPPIWLVWHRLWLALIVYICAGLIVGFLAGLHPGTAAAYLSILPGLFLLLEGNQLIVRKLEQSGWHFDGIVEAGSKEDAELKFFMNNAHDVFSGTHNQTAHSIVKPSAPVHTFSGLFPE